MKGWWTLLPQNQSNSEFRDSLLASFLGNCSLLTETSWGQGNDSHSFVGSHSEPGMATGPEYRYRMSEI